MVDFEKYAAIVKTQEEMLRFDEFTHDDALDVGMRMIKAAKENYGRPISVRVDLNDITVFYYLMENAGLSNDWWMKKKLNGSRRTGCSSFMNYLTIEGPGRMEEFPWAKQQGNIALRGGCFPIRRKNGEIYGYIMTSGMKQVEDHQIIVDALTAFAGKEVPSVIGGIGEIQP